ncbi:hypothetical protein ACIRJ3_38450 [Streptomyces anulatus]
MSAVASGPATSLNRVSSTSSPSRDRARHNEDRSPAAFRAQQSGGHNQPDDSK